MKALLLVLVLAACAAPDPLVRSANGVDVPVPVRGGCVDVEEIPPLPANHIPKTAGGIEQKAAGASAEVRAQDAYIKRAEVIMRRCAAPTVE